MNRHAPDLPLACPPLTAPPLSNMKHVWMINHYAEEPEGAGGTRHFSLAKYLPEFGWTASIIGASTEHLSGRQRLAAGEQARLERFGGIPFLWLKTPTYSGNGPDRILNMLTFTLRLLKPANLSALERPDLIIGSSVHPFAAWAAMRLARRHGVPFVFEVRDLWPQALINMGRLKESSPSAHFLRRLEKSLYRAAERILVLWPNAGAYIQTLGIPPEKVIWLSNGIDVAEWPAEIPPARNEQFTLMYFGAHGGANGLDNVVRAMRLLEDHPRGSGIRLRLIGDGPQKADLRALAKSLGVWNIAFEDPVPKSMIPELASQADAFIFSLIDVPMFNYGISPRKLYDFMAAQRPVIFCCRAANNPVEEAGAGITVAPGQPEELAEAILTLAATPQSEREKMGAAARHHVEKHYAYHSLAERLAHTLDAAVHQRDESGEPRIKRILRGEPQTRSGS